MNYDKYKKTSLEIQEKFINKESFKLVVSATWCPDCNVLKYGTEEPSDGKGKLADYINDEYIMFEEDVHKDDRNIELIPLMVHIEDITGVCHRDISYGFCEEEKVHKKLPNANSYRPYIPFVMIVKDGIPTYIQSTFEDEDVWYKINDK